MPEMKVPSQNQYWISGETEDVVNRLAEFHGTWTIWGTNPVIQAWVRNSIAYYSHILDPVAWESSLVFEGEQGELILFQVRTRVSTLTISSATWRK